MEKYEDTPIQATLSEDKKFFVVLTNRMNDYKFEVSSVK